MTIEVPCSGCGQKLQVGPEHAGKMARCPVCGHITPVPTESGPSVPSPAAASLPAETSANWYMRTPEGQEYGPTSRGDVERWVAEGRVTAECQLRCGATAPWQSADREFPALTPASPAPAWTPPQMPPSPAAYPASGVAPPAAAPFAGGFSTPAHGTATATNSSYQVQHRGGLILLLGLLGIILQPCPGPVFAIAAWVMGSNDLREMDSGRMDRSGADLTRAGMIMGMIIAVLWIVGLLGMGALIFFAALSG